MITFREAQKIMTARLAKRLLLCFSIALLASRQASSFPSGAGSCAAGSAAISSLTGPHGALLNIGGGDITDRGFQILLDGKILQSVGINNVTIKEDHVLELSGAVFRGFLIRLDGSSSDTTDSLSPSHSEVQVSDQCVSGEGVGGLTHTNRLDKMGMRGVIKLHDAEIYTLDISVVVSTSYNAWSAEWYASSFVLNGVVMETYPPSSVTSFMSSEHPTFLPNPSSTPSIAVSKPSSLGPSIEPSGEHSANPSIDVSSLPTSIPSSAESTHPSTSFEPTTTRTSPQALASSSNPTGSNAPTAKPTVLPTKKPPSNYPSRYPSSSPSQNPLFHPSQYPSPSPSYQPSRTQSESPSRWLNSYSPSLFIASRDPSSYPSDMVTTTTPTISSSVIPETVYPVMEPTALPSTNFDHTISPTLKASQTLDIIQSRPEPSFFSASIRASRVWISGALVIVCGLMLH